MPEIIAPESETHELHKNAGAGGRLGLFHNVFDVLFNRLFRDTQRMADLLVCPTFKKMFHDGHFALGQMETLLALLKDGLRAAPDDLHCDEDLRLARIGRVW